jgi:hypothetical protein
MLAAMLVDGLLSPIKKLNLNYFTIKRVKNTQIKCPKY